MVPVGIESHRGGLWVSHDPSVNVECTDTISLGSGDCAWLWRCIRSRGGGNRGRRMRGNSNGGIRLSGHIYLRIGWLDRTVVERVGCRC